MKSEDEVNTAPASPQEDPHARWKKGTASDAAIWKYYDTEVAPSIVHKSLAHPDMTFARLYRWLSMARMKCEWVKLKNCYQPQQIRYYAQSPLSWSGRPTEFGHFHASHEDENDIYGWAEPIPTLAEHRVHHPEENHYIGLSQFVTESITSMQSFSCNILRHQKPPDELTRLESDFQKLKNTKNIFEFFNVAARMMYELANFPPLARGTAAVNSWMLENIFQQRFHSPLSIRPQLYDWMAYYDSPEQYQQYFVMSAIIKILEQNPSMAKNKSFFESFQALMRSDPNLNENMQKRQAYWHTLRSHCQEALTETTDPSLQLQLQQILAGNLQFRTASDDMVQLVQALKTNDANIEEVINHSKVPREKLLSILEFHENTAKLHLAAVGNDVEEEKLNRLWPELGEFRKLNPQQIIAFKNTLIPRTVVAKPVAGRRMPQPQGYPSSMTQVSHVTIAEANQAPNITKVLLSFYQVTDEFNPQVHKARTQISDAIDSGGLSVSDIATLPMEKLLILSSPLAILLYSANLCIDYRDLNAESIPEIENNILRRLATQYLQEDFQDVENPMIRALLLSATDLYRIGVPFSRLNHTEIIAVKRQLIKAYLEDYFQDPKPLDAMLLDDAVVEDYYDQLIFFQKTMEDNRPAHMFESRKKLAEANISVSTLLTLNKSEISALCEGIHEYTYRSRVTDTKKYDRLEAALSDDGKLALEKYQINLAKSLGFNA